MTSGLIDTTLANWVRRLVPASVKAAAHGVRYRLTGSPNDGFRQAAQLEIAGYPHKAARVLRKLLDLHPADQEAAFKAGRRLWRLGVPVVHDPLFACRVSEAWKHPSVLAFEVDFTYPGLWVSLKLGQQPGPGEGESGDVVKIFLGNILLRPIRLEWRDGVASFQFIVRREVVLLFPLRSCLSITVQDAAQSPRESLASVLVEVPHGDAHLAEQVGVRGMLEKKGGLPPVADELGLRQVAYLDLYRRAQRVFEDALGCKLFILYGTLLGLQRDGDFITGDDDFDVGYVSEAVTPLDLKREAAMYMRSLVRCGFKVSLNRAGRPFRLSDADGPEGVHLDVRPVWSPGDGHVWLHKHARLPISLDGFKTVEKGVLRGVKVWKPAATVSFLEHYYGKGWQVPDPGFSNAGQRDTEQVADVFQQCCFTASEQFDLWREIVGSGHVAHDGGATKFSPLALLPAYPLNGFTSSGSSVPKGT